MRHPVTQTAALSIVLFGLWLLLSGHYTPFLLAIGLISTALSVYVAVRMEIIDDEGVPVIHLSSRIVTYLPWLFWQIVLSNLAVARIVLQPNMPIKPAVLRARGLQRSDLGRVIFANSITLTPGTVTLSVTGEHLYVHALDEDAAGDLETGEMNRLVAALERKGPTA